MNGCLWHLSGQCDLQVQDDFNDPRENSPFSSWLRAIPPSMARLKNEGSGNDECPDDDLSSVLIEQLKHRFDLFGCSVDSKGKSGGLAILWDRSADVVLQSFSPNHIDHSVKTKEDSDFIEILQQSEKAGGPPCPQWKMRNFRMILTTCDLSDIGYRGDPFTWSNRHTFPDTMQERLDPACTNIGWSKLFPNAFASHLSMSCSDHKALFIQLRENPATVPRRSNPWRFEAGWLQSPQCEEVVSSDWSTVAMFRSDGGDQNTGFFHRKASHRFQTNLIRKLKDSKGSWITDIDDIQRYIVHYFQSIFASNHPRDDDIAKGTEHLCRVVDEGMREDLV
ncbi:UNVERIFIED_CONTAM: hypothetical protein Slati_0218000 [Sesamum latifolium]|uniref:Uncharacterized protein n=1 Tax=Sesamum latifolium TaxID=2727402 RepID=A0AAW2YCB8_9LAMI